MLLPGSNGKRMRARLNVAFIQCLHPCIIIIVVIISHKTVVIGSKLVSVFNVVPFSFHLPEGRVNMRQCCSVH